MNAPHREIKLPNPDGLISPDSLDHSNSTVTPCARVNGRCSELYAKPGYADRCTTAVRRVVTAINDRIGDRFNNEVLAEIACFSPYHFSRIFRRITGVPPIQFLYAARLQRAKELLAQTDLSITEICFEVGYRSLGTFTTRFSASIGTSPSAFRRLSRTLRGIPLSSIRPFFDRMVEVPSSAVRIQGVVAPPPQFKGMVFVGLFSDAVPDGPPTACSIADSAGNFLVPVPLPGRWYLMAVAVPWAADCSSLLTLHNCARGVAGPIDVMDDCCIEPCSIVLGPPQPCMPPILISIPALLLANGVFRIDPAQSDLRPSPFGARFQAGRPDMLP
jgi:AraC family transcriptional regulator